jgi:hypothetical protein
MMRRHALRYAHELEWPIFPIYEPLEDGSCSCGKHHKSSGKHPRTWRGVKAATINTKQIKKWWRLWPDANIGLSTNNGLVLDIDGPKGERDLRRLEKKYGKLPKTVEAVTRKGRHLFFGVSKRVPCGTHVLGSLQIDARGKGGYVLLAPSRHASGFCYRWKRSPFVYELADAPRWLEKRLRCNFNSQASKKSTKGGKAPRLGASGARDESRSGIDARNTLALMRQGASDEDARDMLLKSSSKAREEGERYIERTIEWARSFHQDGLARVRVLRARIERLGATSEQGHLVRIVLTTTTRFWKKIVLQVVVPSKSYRTQKIKDTFRAVVGKRAKPRELRRFAHGRDVLFLFPTELRFDVARDRFGNVRFVREVRQ